MLSRVLKLAGILSQEERDNKLYNDLVRHEARVGGKLFGPVPSGIKREFFCLDESTWLWHDEWKDKNGKKKTRTTRYEIRPDSIVKIHNGKYQYLSKSEAARFFDAIAAYERVVMREIYNRV